MLHYTAVALLENGVHRPYQFSILDEQSFELQSKIDNIFNTTTVKSIVIVESHLKEGLGVMYATRDARKLELVSMLHGPGLFKNE